MPDVTFGCPDLTTFCRLDELGLEVTGQRSKPIVLSWRAGSWSRISGAAGVAARAYRATR